MWRLVDTAGIRRRVHMAQGADFYASLRTSAALEKAEWPSSCSTCRRRSASRDVRIIDLVLESGRSLVLAFNKWDRLNDDDLENADRRRYLEREIEQDLAHVAWAPRVNISAKTGRHLDKLVPALETALENWDRRIPTGKFNAFLAELVAEHPHPLRGGKQRASCSARRRRRARRRSCCSRPASSTPGTVGSSSGVCASSTRSRARRSSSTCVCVRSASADLFRRMSRRGADTPML